MALNNLPYLKFFVQDWLSNTKLKMCSMAAHGLMVNIMAIAHKEEDYGYILLKQNFKQNNDITLCFAKMLAKLLPFDSSDIYSCLLELIAEKVLHLDGEKLVCHRMVRDFKLSVTRSESGREGGKNTTKKHTHFAQAKSEAKEQANTDNEHDNEYESDSDSKKGVQGEELVASGELRVVSDELPRPTHWPSREECINYFVSKGKSDVDGIRFFNHYEAQAWCTSGFNVTPITRWRAKADDWILNPKLFGTAKQEAKNETKPEKIISEDKYANIPQHATRTTTAA
jgi:hypothetical protein